MNPDKDQVFIYNSAELQLIKAVFSENDELLYAIRKVFLQFELTENDRQMIKTQVTPEVIKVLRKRILPTPSNEFPLGQISGLLTTLTNDIKSKSVEEMEPLINAKVTEIEYLEQQFAVLASLDTKVKIVLSRLANVTGRSANDAYVSLTAYLFILGFIDPCLLMIKSIAGTKEETPSQQVHRMKRDSSK